MPNVHLTDHEAKAIIAYLKSLSPAGLVAQAQL
jgi:cytochrome c1